MFAVIKDFPNYSISTEGVVMNNRTGKILAGARDKDGYRYIILCDKGRRRCCRVHREVALMFIPNPDNLPVLNHKDGVKDNNSVDNLEWCTISYNTAHAYKIGSRSQSGDRNNAAKFSDDVVESVISGYDGGSVAKYARELGMPYAVVYSYVRGLRRSSTTIPKGSRAKRLEAVGTER